MPGTHGTKGSGEKEKGRKYKKVRARVLPKEEEEVRRGKVVVWHGGAELAQPVTTPSAPQDPLKRANAGLDWLLDNKIQ